MSKAAWGAIAALAVAVAAGGGYWLGNAGKTAPVAAAPTKGGPGAPGAAAQAVPVETAAVEAIRLPQAITAVGSLRSDESITLRPEVAGRIASIQFQEGQRVTKGTTLVRLDAAINQAKLQALASVVSAVGNRVAREIEDGFELRY